MSERNGGDRERSSVLGARAITGIVVVLLLFVFLAVNRDDTEVSFIFFTTTTALWAALGVAAVGGFLAGFVMGRSRYRTRGPWEDAGLGAVAQSVRAGDS